MYYQSELHLQLFDLIFFSCSVIQPHLLGETLSSFHLLCCDKMLWWKHPKRDGLFGVHSQSTAHHRRKGKEVVIWRHLGTSLNFTSPAHSFQLGFQAHLQVPTCCLNTCLLYTLTSSVSIHVQSCLNAFSVSYLYFFFSFFLFFSHFRQPHCQEGYNRL